MAKRLCSGTLNLSIDSTGFSLDASSYHYSSRIRRMEKNRSYVKASMAVDTGTHCVAAVKIRLKRRHDTVDAIPLLNRSRHVGGIQAVVADRRYDSEELMQYIEHEIRAKPIIALKHMNKPLKRTRGQIRIIRQPMGCLKFKTASLSYKTPEEGVQRWNTIKEAIAKQ